MIAPGTHVIEGVSEPKPWVSDYGPMNTFTIRVQADDAGYDLNRKQTSPAPTIGQTIEVASVTPSNGDYPAKIKLAAPQGGGGGGGNGAMNPEREAKIVRQHSQMVAVEYVKFAHERGTLPDGFQLKDLTTIIDWFESDAMGAKP